MRISRSLAVGATCALGLALVVGSGPAFADPGAQPGDVVGVGSDTLQNFMDFVADGNPAETGVPAAGGYNSAGNVNRMFNYSATADMNDRLAYPNSSSTPLDASVILRAGTNPRLRPNGSGAGANALAADTGSPRFIDYTRSSSTGALKGIASTVAGGLHVVKLATDDLVMAASLTTHALPNLTGAQLVHIYQCDAGFTDWSSLGGTAGTIVPIVPQVGSGTRGTFLNDLQTINGGTAITLGGCVKTSEENDPLAISGTTYGDPLNTIGPLSSGRKQLWDNGYFKVPSTGAAETSGVQLLYGTQTANSCTAPSSNQTINYCDTRGLYVGFRQTDTTLPAWQPGGSRNWVQTLLWTGTSTKPYVQTTGGQALIGAGGVTPTYVDCGVITSSFVGC